MIIDRFPDVQARSQESESKAVRAQAVMMSDQLEKHMMMLQEPGPNVRNIKCGAKKKPKMVKPKME